MNKTVHWKKLVTNKLTWFTHTAVCIEFIFADSFMHAGMTIALNVFSLTEVTNKSCHTTARLVEAVAAVLAFTNCWTLGILTGDVSLLTVSALETRIAKFLTGRRVTYEVAMFTVVGWLTVGGAVLAVVELWARDGQVKLCLTLDARERRQTRAVVAFSRVIEARAVVEARILNTRHICTNDLTLVTIVAESSTTMICQH